MRYFQTTINLIQIYLKLINVNTERKRLAVQFAARKSPLYLTENLPSGQLPHVLWFSPKNKSINNSLESQFWYYHCYL
jgi:hypothetical protein